MTTHDSWLVWLLYIVLFVTPILLNVLQARFPAVFKTDEQKRLTEIERKLNRIMDALNVPLQASPDGEVEDFLRRGMKINAIKVYREQNGSTLVAAKDAVEALEAEMKARGLI